MPPNPNPKNFWGPFAVMAAVLMVVYAIRPQLANGILWLFIILAAAEIFVQGGLKGA